MYKIMGQVMLLIIGVTAVCIVGGIVIGLRLLELLYAVDLSGQLKVLIIILMAGGVSACNIVMYYCCVIMGKERNVLFSYILVSGLALLVVPFLTSKMALGGAAIGYLCVVVVLFIQLLGVLLKEHRNLLGRIEDEKNA